MTAGLFSRIKRLFAGLPAYSTNKESLMAADVKVFALSTCIHCKNAKAYLDECGVKYECVHVDLLKGEERQAVVDEVKTHNPSVSFPTIVIRGQVVVGFNKEKIDEALKK